MSDILQPSQYCGRHGNTIFEAVAAIRDIVAYTEVYKESVCLLTIDFKEAFDLFPTPTYTQYYGNTDLVKNSANEYKGSMRMRHPRST
jgi:hypothetical protein